MGLHTHDVLTALVALAPLSAAATGWSAPSALASVPVNPKRGFVADEHTSCDTPLLLNTSGWYYGYERANPYRKAGLKGDCARANATDQHRFAPMDWCLGSVNESVPADVDQTYWMGFNEPNNVHNCNTPPEAVAREWAHMMELHPEPTILVSPATAGNGTPWYDDFFANCTALYGDKGCRITYLATHRYSCTPNHTMAYLKSLYDRYGYKVWLTEFSCGDGAEQRSTAEHIAFMKAILPLLDAAEYVYRYSWMSAWDAHALRGLVEANSDTGKIELTELGRIWNGP